MAVPASFNDIVADPSVVLWSIANEPESDTEGAEEYFRPLFDLTRDLDATRPVGFVNVMLAPYGKCRVSQVADVLMLNRYYGWYLHTGDLPAPEQAWEQELRGWATENKPICGPGCATVRRAGRLWPRRAGPSATEALTGLILGQ